MYCPKCGVQNPDDAKVCNSCSSELPKAPQSNSKLIPKTSGLAIAAFVLGILSLFSCGLTVIPAIILGVVSFVIIEKSGGRLTGTNFSVLGVIIPVCVCLVLGILLPALLHARRKAFRMACGTNLAVIGMAMLVYANDYDDQLPRSGGKDTTWANRIPDWKADNRITAYGLADDGTGGHGSITSCFYLLVKYAKESPKSFICRGDKGTTAFNPVEEGVGDLAMIDLWDFGTEPSKHCSYSYHQPFSNFPLTTSSEPGMAVAADRNPLQDSPAATAKTWPGIYNPDGGREAVKYGNAITHQEDAQNVLFMDFHVGQEKRPFCGINDDNIYTFWDGGDIRIGAPPTVGSKPSTKLDSLLVHDPPWPSQGIH
jgi:hypothetical protein